MCLLTVLASLPTCVYPEVLQRWDTRFPPVSTLYQVRKGCAGAIYLSRSPIMLGYFPFDTVLSVAFSPADALFQSTILLPWLRVCIFPHGTLQQWGTRYCVAITKFTLQWRGAPLLHNYRCLPMNHTLWSDVGNGAFLDKQVSVISFTIFYSNTKFLPPVYAGRQYWPFNPDSCIRLMYCTPDN